MKNVSINFLACSNDSHCLSDNGDEREITRGFQCHVISKLNGDDLIVTPFRCCGGQPGISAATLDHPDKRIVRRDRVLVPHLEQLSRDGWIGRRGFHAVPFTMGATLIELSMKHHFRRIAAPARNIGDGRP